MTGSALLLKRPILSSRSLSSRWGLTPLYASDLLSNLATSTAVSLIKLWLVLGLVGGGASTVGYVATYVTLNSVIVFVVGLTAGAYVDRNDHVSVMVQANVARALSSLLTIAVLMLHGNDVLPSDATFALVTLLALVSTACDTIYFPATSALSVQLASGGDLVRALGYLRVTSMAGDLAGPILAGWGAARQWWAPVLLVETLCLIASAALIHSCRGLISTGSRTGEEEDRESAAGCAGGADSMDSRSAAPKERGDGARSQASKQSYWETWATGYRAARDSVPYRILLPFALIEAIGASALSLVTVYYFTQTIRASADWYGLYTAAVTLGYLLGYGLAARLTARVPFYRLLLLSNLGVAFSLLALSLTSAPLVCCLLGTSMSLTQSIVGPAFQAVFSQGVDESLVGQAMSLFMAITSIVGALAVPVAGVLITWLRGGGLAHLASGDVAYSATIGFVATLHAGMALLAVTAKRIRGIRVHEGSFTEA